MRNFKGVTYDGQMFIVNWSGDKDELMVLKLFINNHQDSQMSVFIDGEKRCILARDINPDSFEPVD